MKNIEIIGRIAEGMAIRNISAKELATRIGIDPATLSRKMHDKNDFSLADINRIERVLKIKIIQVVHESI